MRRTPLAVFLVAAALVVVLFVYVFDPVAVGRGLAWAGLGALIGWVGSIVRRSGTQAAILLDMLAGAAGVLAGLLLYGGGSLTEGGTMERVLSAMFGSILLVWLAGLVRRAT